MAKVKTGKELLTCNGKGTGYSLNDFWRWSSSDLLNNALRGVLAEFIVAAAMDIDITEGREEWAAWDLTYKAGDSEIRLEIKSGAYVQSWEQKKPSNIIFGIQPTRSWTPEDGYSEIVKRQSDVYVFCVFAEKEREKADPLQLDKWEFYAVSTAKLDEVCGSQKTISLNSLKKLDPIQTDFPGLKTAVLKAVVGKGA